MFACFDFRSKLSHALVFVSYETDRLLVRNVCFAELQDFI